MLKFISGLFLLLSVAPAYAQTAGNPSFSSVTTNTVVVSSPRTSTPQLSLTGTVSGTPSSVLPSIFNVLDGCIGTGTTFVGCVGAYFKVSDAATVTTGNKGVLYGLDIDIAPKYNRNNSPYDDADALVVSNAGTGRGTEAIYMGHNAALTQGDFLAGIGVDMWATVGMYFSGTYSYGISFCNSISFCSTLTNGAILVPKPTSGTLNILSLGGDTARPSNNTNAFLVDSNNNLISNVSNHICNETWAYATCAAVTSSLVIENNVGNHLTLLNGSGTDVWTVSINAGTGNLNIDHPKGSGVISLNSEVDMGAALALKKGVVASLPSCVSGREGNLYSVTDADSATFNATVAGGGANHVMAYCNGTSWTVH